MTISVIIPTYNNQQTIRECLNSLSNQTQKAKEIILIDDGSTDTTPSVVSSFKDVTLLEQNHQGPGIARNRGSLRATGDIFVFVDADMVFDKEFLHQLTKPIVHGKVKGTFFKEEYVKNWDNPWARMWNWEYTHSTTNRRVPETAPDTAPVFRAILATEFAKVNGFTPGGYNDDWTLSQKLGYLSVNAPGAKAYHANPGSIREIYAQAKWVAKRTYKWGEWGRAIAFFRANPLFSLAKGIYRALLLKNVHYLIFKIVYDSAIMHGIVEYWLKGRHEK